MSKAKQKSKLPSIQQMMGQLEKEICERDPGMALRIGRMQKERIEYNKAVDEEISRNETDDVTRVVRNMFEGPRLGREVEKMIRSVCWNEGYYMRELSSGGSYRADTYLELRIREIIGAVLEQKGRPEDRP